MVTQRSRNLLPFGVFDTPDARGLTRVLKSKVLLDPRLLDRGRLLLPVFAVALVGI
jgi:hypothetical protein